MTEAQIVENKPSLCSTLRQLKTRPGCCSLSSHCLLKCWHLGLNGGFKFSPNNLERLYGTNPLFSCADLTTPYCAMHSCANQLVAPQGLQSPLRIELIKHEGFWDEQIPKKTTQNCVFVYEGTHNSDLQNDYLVDHVQDLLGFFWKAPSFPLSPRNSLMSF